MCIWVWQCDIMDLFLYSCTCLFSSIPLKIWWTVQLYGWSIQGEWGDPGIQRHLGTSSQEDQCCTRFRTQSCQQSIPNLRLQPPLGERNLPWWAGTWTEAGSLGCSGEHVGRSWISCYRCTWLDIRHCALFWPFQPWYLST